jgi:hypothetical protein
MDQCAYTRGGGTVQIGASPHAMNTSVEFTCQLCKAVSNVLVPFEWAELPRGVDGDVIDAVPAAPSKISSLVLLSQYHDVHQQIVDVVPTVARAIATAVDAPLVGALTVSSTLHLAVLQLLDCSVSSGVSVAGGGAGAGSGTATPVVSGSVVTDNTDGDDGNDLTKATVALLRNRRPYAALFGTSRRHVAASCEVCVPSVLALHVCFAASCGVVAVSPFDTRHDVTPCSHA